MQDIPKKLFDTRNAVFLLFLIIAMSLMYNTLKVIQKNYELQTQVDLLADEVALIKLQNQNLKYSIEYYKTDAFLQVEAKRRFNLSEKGEIVAFLPKDGDLPVEDLQPIVDSLEEDPEYQDNFDQWMNFLFGRVR